MAWRYLTTRLWEALEGYGEHTAVGDLQTVSAERALRVPSSLGCSPNFYLPRPHARRPRHPQLQRAPRCLYNHQFQTGGHAKTQPLSSSIFR